MAKNIKKVDTANPVTQADPITDTITTTEATAIVALNVRSLATLDSKIVCILAAGDKISVYNNFPNDSFYKVSLISNGIKVNGFCMKKFVKLFKE